MLMMSIEHFGSWWATSSAFMLPESRGGGTIEKFGDVRVVIQSTRFDDQQSTVGCDAGCDKMRLTSAILSDYT